MYKLVKLSHIDDVSMLLLVWERNKNKITFKKNIENNWDWNTLSIYYHSKYIPSIWTIYTYNTKNHIHITMWIFNYMMCETRDNFERKILYLGYTCEHIQHGTNYPNFNIPIFPYFTYIFFKEYIDTCTPTRLAYFL